MRTSTWPSKGNYWALSAVGFELDSCCVIEARRSKKNLGPDFTFAPGGSVGACRRSRNSVGYGSQTSCGTLKFEKKLKCGFFLGYIDLTALTLFKPKKSRFGDLAPLAWALEEQAIGSEIIRENGSSADNISINSEGEGINCLDSFEVQGGNCEEKMHGNVNCGEDGEENGTKIDVPTLALSLQSAETVEDMEAILKNKGELSLRVYSIIIRGFVRDKRMDSALILLNWMKRKKIETQGSSDPNLYIYNTLMAIYLEKGEGDKALTILEEILKNGLTPSPVSYSQALLAYRRMEDGHGALNFFVEFREKYRQGDIKNDNDEEDWENEFKKIEKFTIRVCYQVMRRWLVSRDNLSDNVLKLLDNMDNAGIPSSRAELEWLVWACTREDHYIVAKELYSRLRERYTEISLSVCNHVIWLMGKAKKWWAALEVYEDLMNKGPKPNNLSYELIMSHFNILLTAAKKRGIWRWGVRLLNKMEDKGLKPRSKEWNAVLVACSKASETTAAVQIFKRMVENGEKPTVISYGALLSALEKGKLYVEALHVWEHMLKVGVKPNAYAYTIMASIYAAQGNLDRVDAIIHEILTLGIELTVVTYNAIISGCARNGMSSAAYEWFHRMKVQNISPNKITYEMLIEALAKDGKPRLAHELYVRAKNEGLKLSSKGYDVVLQSSQANGDTIDLSDLGPRPPDKKNKPRIRKTLNEFRKLADVPRKSKPFDRREISNSQTKEGNE